MLAGPLSQSGTAQYEHTGVRNANRNGYRERTLRTRYGETVFLDSMRHTAFPKLGQKRLRTTKR